MEEIEYNAIYKLNKGKYYVSSNSFKKLIGEEKDKLILLLKDLAVNIATNDYIIPISIITSYPYIELEYNEDIVRTYQPAEETTESFKGILYAVLSTESSNEEYNQDLLESMENEQLHDDELHETIHNTIKYILPQDDDPSSDEFYFEAWDQFADVFYDKMMSWSWNDVRESLLILMSDCKDDPEDLLRKFQTEEWVKQYFNDDEWDTTDNKDFEDDEDDEDYDTEYYPSPEDEIILLNLEKTYVKVLMNLHDPDIITKQVYEYLQQCEYKMAQEQEFDIAIMIKDYLSVATVK